MPRNDDWDDDDDRPRRRRMRDDDDDDYHDDYVDRRLRRGERSGAVTAVGVINIVLGSLYVLGGLCLLLGGALVGGAAQDFRGNPGGGLFAVFAGAIILFAFLIIVVAVLHILGGVGVLNRRNWARILTLVLGGLSAVFALFGVFGVVGALNNPVADDRAGAVLVSLVSVFFHVGYAVLVYVILLNPGYAEEFE